MHRLRLHADARTASERVEALDRARESADAKRHLDEALEHLEQARSIAERTGPKSPVPPAFWAPFEEALESFDAYVAHIIEHAGLRLACHDRCSACCSEAAGALPIESLHMVRALRGRADSHARFQRSVDLARAFQALLIAHAGPRPSLDVASSEYRRTHLEWRLRQQPCPVLGDDGRCVAYAERPLACRIHFSLEDPFHCEPSSERYARAERPRVVAHERELAFERGLKQIGESLGLPASPNLMWGLARLHDTDRL